MLFNTENIRCIPIDFLSIQKGFKIVLTCMIIMMSSFSCLGQIEICDNGLDDDNDNEIDLNDSDCICELVTPISLIPNPSFEDMNCCPDNRSQLDCASLWIQASEPTTDYIHTCNWLGWDQFPPPQPFPDGEGIMGFRDGRVRNNNTNAEPYWKEYAGACLLSPLRKDTAYRFQFDVGFVDPQKSPPIDITFFGTSDCVNLPFGIGDDAFGCPTNSPDWVKLGEVRVSGNEGNKWVNTKLEIIPDEDIYAIAIGPSCQPISSPISIYYFFDNLLLSDLESFQLEIKEAEHPCSADYNFSVPFNSDFSYQWYKSGVALVGETFSTIMNNYGEGSYQVRILDDESCRVSASFIYEIPEFEEAVSVSICEGDTYTFGDLDISEPGVYLDTFKNSDNCDRIVTLDLNVIGARYDTVSISILDGESFNLGGRSFEKEGNYAVTLTSSIECDSLVLLQLSTFDIYFPNVFSPNRDGVNDFFGPIGNDDKIRSIEMSIFDRWGNLLFSGTEWDGGDAEPGVYVYQVKLNFDYDFSKTFSGTITILK